jgi:glutamate racemase
MEKDVKLVIIACNTASSLSLDFLKRCFRVPMIGVIEPGAKGAVSVTRNNHIGIIGTNATILSGAYEKAIRKLNSRVRVTAKGCPLFVPLVEEGWLSTPVTKQTASIYLAPLKEAGIDTLIMGCTHYPLLRRTIQDVMGGGVLLIDSAKEVAKEAKTILDSLGLMNRQKKRGRHNFFVSDEPHRFTRVAERFLRKKITCVRRAIV